MGCPANRRFDFDRGAHVSFRASITSQNAPRVVRAREPAGKPALHAGFNHVRTYYHAPVNAAGVVATGAIGAGQESDLLLFERR